MAPSRGGVLAPGMSSWSKGGSSWAFPSCLQEYVRNFDDYVTNIANCKTAENDIFDLKVVSRVVVSICSRLMVRTVAWLSVGIKSPRNQEDALCWVVVQMLPGAISESMLEIFLSISNEIGFPRE